MNGASGDFETRREAMVREQLAGRGIRDPRVLDAMRSIPRHRFVPDHLQDEAYADRPLPIGVEQTISQPYIVALMSELLGLRGGETVLEVGTGSGYQTAVLAKLAGQVHSLEIQTDLAERAGALLGNLDVRNVEVLLGDGSQGLPDEAPFDAILVTAGAPAVPGPLLAQLKPGGRLVLPVGEPDGQFLERWTRRGQSWQSRRITPVAFVPLVGEHGWKHHP